MAWARYDDMLPMNRTTNERSGDRLAPKSEARSTDLGSTSKRASNEESESPL